MPVAKVKDVTEADRIVLDRIDPDITVYRQRVRGGWWYATLEKDKEWANDFLGIETDEPYEEEDLYGPWTIIQEGTRAPEPPDPRDAEIAQLREAIKYAVPRLLAAERALTRKGKNAFIRDALFALNPEQEKANGD